MPSGELCSSCFDFSGLPNVYQKIKIFVLCTGGLRRKSSQSLRFVRCDRVETLASIPGLACPGLILASGAVNARRVMRPPDHFSIDISTAKYSSADKGGDGKSSSRFFPMYLSFGANTLFAMENRT